MSLQRLQWCNTNAGISSYVPIREKLAIELFQGLDCRGLPAWLTATLVAGGPCAPFAKKPKRGFERSGGNADVHRRQKAAEEGRRDGPLGTEPSRGHLVRFNIGRTAWT